MKRAVIVGLLGGAVLTVVLYQLAGPGRPDADSLGAAIFLRVDDAGAHTEMTTTAFPEPWPAGEFRECYLQPWLVCRPRYYAEMHAKRAVLVTFEGSPEQHLSWTCRSTPAGRLLCVPGQVQP